MSEDNKEVVAHNPPQPIEMLQDSRLLEVDKLVREYAIDWKFPKGFHTDESMRNEYSQWCRIKATDGILKGFRLFKFEHDEIYKIAKHQVMEYTLKSYVQLWDSILRNHTPDAYLF